MLVSAAALLKGDLGTLRNVRQSEKIARWIRSCDVSTVVQGWCFCYHFSAFSLPQLRIFNSQDIRTQRFFLFLGTVGFFACFFYLRRVYSNISSPEKPVTTWMVEHCISYNVVFCSLARLLRDVRACNLTLVKPLGTPVLTFESGTGGRGSYLP